MKSRLLPSVFSFLLDLDVSALAANILQGVSSDPTERTPNNDWKKPKSLVFAFANSESAAR